MAELDPGDGVVEIIQDGSSGLLQVVVKEVGDPVGR